MTEYGEFIVRVRNADLIPGSPFDTPYFHGEIVRCRDCRFFKHNSFPRCDLHMQAVEVEPDGFCSWGERRYL